MTASKELVDFIAKCEGFRSTAYKPLPTDRWTIGFGSTMIDDKPVVASQVILMDDARRALAADINTIYRLIMKKGLPAGLPQRQLDAVISLVYNIGFGRFAGSATCNLFYGGHDISDRFELYNMSGGKIIPGLTKRRLQEKEIYVNGNYGA